MKIQSTPPPPPPQKPQKTADYLLDQVRETTDWIDSNPITRGAIYDTFSLSRTLHAFPKFIYPTISGATPAERSFILQTLDSLPLKDVNSVKSLEVVPAIPNASGLAFRQTVTNTIKLGRDQISISPDWFREVTTHEVGHTKDYASAWFQHPGLGNNSNTAPWGKAPFVTDYAKTNHFEDYADSYAKYHLAPDELKKANPEKYALIDQQEKLGPLDRLIDRKEFRETGKWLGEHIAPNQAVRTGIETAFWATGALQMVHGLDQMRKGCEENDPKSHMMGVLNTVAGGLFATQLLSGAGLAVQGASHALDRAVKKGEITAFDGDAAVRLVSAPVEKTAHYVGQVLGLAHPGPTPAAPSGPVEHRARAVGIGLGGAAGGLAGGLAGPYAGVLAGYHLAGPVGGTVGLVVGGLAGFLAGSTLGGEAGGALVKAFGG